jgi:hypothetical protein
MLLLLQILASSSYDDSIKMYAEEDDDWECFDTLRDHKSTVWAIDWERDGHRLGMYGPAPAMRESAIGGV